MVDEAFYHNKLKQDGGVILILLVLLYFSETFITYKILSLLWGEVPELGTIWPIYIVFFVLLIGIETIGSVGVYNSIKEHMFDFKYYD
ncbi:MAG: monomethylamine transporter [Euryarchaeota archaeon]|nr:monomethylamine transporter [Euryarchaeota archaeon]